MSPELILAGAAPAGLAAGGKKEQKGLGVEIKSIFKPRWEGKTVVGSNGDEAGCLIKEEQINR